jgi:hypothetical protein
MRLSVTWLIEFLVEATHSDYTLIDDLYSSHGLLWLLFSVRSELKEDPDKTQLCNKVCEAGAYPGNQTVSSHNLYLCGIRVAHHFERVDQIRNVQADD